MSEPQKNQNVSVTESVTDMSSTTETATTTATATATATATTTTTATTIPGTNNTMMDERNQKAMNVMQTQGLQAAVKHMCTDDETGRALTYGEMRARYG